MSAFSVEQTSETGNFDANLILRQNTLVLMSEFIEIKSFNTKLTENQIPEGLRFSDSTLGGYRKDIQMRSPYR